MTEKPIIRPMGYDNGLDGLYAVKDFGQDPPALICFVTSGEGETPADTLERAKGLAELVMLGWGVKYGN
jgi:hypothetical protein